MNSLFVKNIFAGINFIAILLYGLKADAQSNKPNSSAIPAVVSGNVYQPVAYEEGSKVNYIRTWDALGPFQTIDELLTAGRAGVRQTTQYIDGLGRPLQTVSRQATPGGKDLVAPVVYDAFGRESYKFLPYASTAADGHFKMDPFADQAAALGTAYPGEQVFYQKIDYEASPLNRVLKTMAPGNSWAGSDNGLEQKYLVNTVADGVRIWNISYDALTYTGNDVTTNIPVSPAAYAAGQLYKTVTLDEAGHAVVEYKDKQGQVVLKKVQIGTIASDYSGHSGFLCTYYVYDDFGLLRFVLPPKAVEAIQSGWSLSGQTAVLNELCFRYEYDGRQRMTAKKVPGAGWVYLVYDVCDRLVFTQDANMREKDQWLTTLYDDLNRPVLTGMIYYSGTPAALQTGVTEQTASATPPAGLQAQLTLNSPSSGLFQALESITLENGFESIDNDEFTAEIFDGGDLGLLENQEVNKNPIPPTATFWALTMTYYDDYAWTSDSYSATNNSKLVPGDNPYSEGMPSTSSMRVKGMITGTKVRVIEDPDNLAAGPFLATMNFYDEKGRVIQTRSEQPGSGSYQLSSNLYDFSGKVLCNYLEQHTPGATPAATTIRTDFNYDLGGRLLKTAKTINDDPDTHTLIAENEYNELGQLITKKLGRQKDAGGAYTTEPVETQDYTYNVRGWLKGLNQAYANGSGPDRWFGMELNYDWGFATNQLNGNIAGTKWRSKGDRERRAYGYGYDPANRLLSGDFSQYEGSDYGDNPKIDFDVKMGDGSDPTSAYDANGNIKKMQQKGIKGVGSCSLDDLTYTYHTNGNKLSDVTDAVTADNKLGDFTDKHIGANDYGYDANGNLVTDLNKGIKGSTGLDLASGGAITYNHLNLPALITVKQDDGATLKGTIRYIYDAAGTKWQKITTDQSSSGKTITTTTSYRGGFVYESKTTVPANTPNDDYMDRLQFAGQEEGRIRYAAADIDVTPNIAEGYHFDYFIKDHLGNVRMVLTEAEETEAYFAATLEDSRVVAEQQLYDIAPGRIEALPTPVKNDHPSLEEKAYRVRGVEGEKTGLGIVLKVMAGDKLAIKAESYYNPPPTGGTAGTISNLLVSQLLEAFASGLAGAGKPGITGTELLSNTDLADAANGFLGDPDRTAATAVPKAYLNYLLLDDQLNSQGGDFDKVDEGGTGYKLHTKFFSSPIEVIKNGYIYIYTSNESDLKVLFDNLQVTHQKGRLLEETHYYPFGLTMAGISSKALNGVSENKRKWNKGSELENKEFRDGSGLEVYSTFYRSLDPQLGRFWQTDPKPDYAQSLYSSMKNNPILYNDPLGDTLSTVFRTGFLGIFGKKVTVTYDEKNQRWNNKDESAYTGKTTKFANMVLGDLKTNQKNDLGNAIVTNLATDKLNHNIIKGDPNSNRTDNANIYYSGSVSDNQKILEGGKANYSPSFVVLGHEMAHKFDLNLGIRNKYWFGGPGEERGVDEYNAMYYENVLRQANGLPRRAAYQEFSGVAQGNILDASGNLLPMPAALSSQGASMPAFHALQLFLRSGLY